MQRITPDGTDVFPLYDYKQHDATLTGGEAGFDIHPKDVKWLDIDINYAMTRGKLDGGGDLPFIPADKIISVIKLSADKKILLNKPFVSFTVSNYFKQKRVAEYELPTGEYALLDFFTGGKFKIGKQDAELQLYSTNIFNKDYFNHLSLIKNIGVREMGRNLGFRFKINFGL